MINKFITKLNSLKTLLTIEFQRAVDFIWAKVTGAPALYRSQILHNLFLGGQYSKRGLFRLKEWGITAVVSMRERKPLLFTKTPWLEVLHLPTRDRTAPSIPDLIRGVDFIHREIENGGRVYVHCFWGEGRGPTMAAAYLITTGLTVEDALMQIKKVRTFVRPTQVQFAQLKLFSKTFKN